MTNKLILLKRLRENLRKLRLRVWLLEGHEKQSGIALRMLYAGHELNKNYLAYIAFRDGYRESRLGKAWIWSIAGMAKAITDVALVVTETEEACWRRLGKRNDFYIPCWIDGEIDISRGDRLFRGNENLRDDLRKIRKYKLQYEITRDVDKFGYFYHHMYHPYITKVHGNRAALMSYDVMMSRRDRLDLMLIKREDEYVAGGVIIYESGGARSWSLGVRDGDFRYVKEGAIGALYYYQMAYLSGKGFNKYHVGATRPFLDDGVLQYKKKWGLRLTHPRPGGWWLRYSDEAPGACAFLRENPFIFCKENALSGGIFMPIGDVHDEDKLRVIKAKYAVPGLKEFLIFDYQN